MLFIEASPVLLLLFPMKTLSLQGPDREGPVHALWCLPPFSALLLTRRLVRGAQTAWCAWRHGVRTAWCACCAFQVRSWSWVGVAKAGWAASSPSTRSWQTAGTRTTTHGGPPTPLLPDPHPILASSSPRLRYGRPFPNSIPRSFRISTPLSIPSFPSVPWDSSILDYLATCGQWFSPPHFPSNPSSPFSLKPSLVHCSPAVLVSL